MDRIKRFLVDCRIMDERDASIYVLGLRKGVIASKDVVGEIKGIRQNTAGDVLRRLSKEGCFEETPPSGGGRGRARKFKAVHLKTALPNLVEGLQDFQEDLALLDEHMEIPSEREPEEEIWIMSPPRVAISGLKGLVESAEKTIQISSHDCTWLEETELSSALKSAIDRKVRVTVLASESGKKKIERSLRAAPKVNIKLSNSDSPVFIIIDKKTAVFPLRQRGISSGYHGLRVTNKDLVENFSNLFEELAKRRR